MKKIKKICVQKKGVSQKICVPKKFWSRKNLGLNKKFFPKDFESQKNFGPKKQVGVLVVVVLLLLLVTLENKSQLRPVQVQLSSPLGLRLTRSQTGSGKICVPEKFLVKKFFLGYLNFQVPKSLMSQKFVFPNKFISKTSLGPQSFRSQKILYA